MSLLRNYSPSWVKGHDQPPPVAVWAKIAVSSPQEILVGIFGMMSSRCLKLSLGGGVRQSEKIFLTNIAGSFGGVLPHLKKLATQFSTSSLVLEDINSRE